MQGKRVRSGLTAHWWSTGSNVRGISTRGRITVTAPLRVWATSSPVFRAQIVSNPPPVWPLHINDILEPPTPPFSTSMQLFTLLGADALAQRNEAAAWTDLRAAWVLARSLWDRPEPMSVMIAMSGTRVVASVATKLQPPIPSWGSLAAEARMPRSSVPPRATNKGLTGMSAGRNSSRNVRSENASRPGACVELPAGNVVYNTQKFRRGENPCPF